MGKKRLEGQGIDHHEDSHYSKQAGNEEFNGCGVQALLQLQTKGNPRIVNTEGLKPYS